MIIFNWHDIELATNSIVMELKVKDLKPDYVAGIPRGGILIAVILSHKLNIPYIHNPISSKDKKILLVDDISHTGTTFFKHFNKLYPTYNCQKPITTTIHVHPDSNFIPDIYCEETSEWIKYPWETLETSKADYKEAQTQFDKDMNKVFSKENMAKAAKLR